MDADATREHDPISRISRWESTKGDGTTTSTRCSWTSVVAPRMILPLQDGVILTSETDSDDLVKWSDTNGDGVADKREVVFTGIGQSGDPNIEHQKAGLLWNMDNWIYTTYNAFRIRWTPTGFLREPTGSNGGQWGLASDDDGKPWFVDAGGERGPMNFQYPIHYGGFTPCPSTAGRITGVRAGGPPPPPPSPDCPPGMENGFEKDFAVVWPAPGIGDMQGGLGRTRMPAQNLNHFTASTGPAIVRGASAAGRSEGGPALHRAGRPSDPPRGNREHRGPDAAAERLSGIRVHDERRSAVPAGEHQQRAGRHGLHRRHVSRHHPGAAVVGPGLVPAREDRAVSARQGGEPRPHLAPALRRPCRRCRRPTPTSGSPRFPPIEPDFAPPRMYERDAGAARRAPHARQRLVARHGAAPADPQAGQVGRRRRSSRWRGRRTTWSARFNALWTLEGLGALDARLVRDEMKDASPRMRIQAIRASETLYKAGDKTFADDYRALEQGQGSERRDPGDADAEPVQGRRTRPTVIKAAQAANPAKGVVLVGNQLLAPPAANAFGGGGRRGGALTPEQQKLLQQGSDVFGGVCFSCHGADGRGQPMAGAAPGTTMAPPLAGSPRVQAHRDYVIKVLLNGLTGPVDDKTYPEVMVPMGANSDEWVAGIASYVRNSFGNNGGLVTPADVARVRAETASRKALWTVPEIEASLPRPLDPQQWKLTASHNADAASGAASLRGWNSGAPQAAGMWFQIELPQPAVVTEVQFDSSAAGGQGGGGGRGGRGAGPGSRRSWRSAAARHPQVHRPRPPAAPAAAGAAGQAGPPAAPVPAGRGGFGAGAHAGHGGLPARLLRAVVARRHDLEPAARGRQGRRLAHQRDVRAHARQVPPDHPDGDGDGCAELVDHRPARLRGTRGGVEVSVRRS